ncbi:MAG: PadR family transcriptional regulator [Anaerolineaceae bacterium]|nr:PadR family transcriptional regulator [Anaerolineaceae bacterium]
MLKFALLGFLSYGPMTGYELKQRMDRSTTHFWHAKQSQIYTTLKAMEKDGLVESVIREQRERPDRRVYVITPVGTKELQKWLAEPLTELSPKKEHLVLKMFFSAHQDKQTTLTQLYTQLDLHQKQLVQYQQRAVKDIEQAAIEFPQLTGDVKMWKATRKFGERYEEIYVEWIEEMISLINESS